MVLSAKTRGEINNNRKNHNYRIGFVAKRTMAGAADAPTEHTLALEMSKLQAAELSGFCGLASSKVGTSESGLKIINQKVADAV
jgi:hypothetical protein